MIHRLTRAEPYAWPFGFHHIWLCGPSHLAPPRPHPALRLSPHPALWSQPPCATQATPGPSVFTTSGFVPCATLGTPGPSVFTPHLSMWSRPLCATHLALSHGPSFGIVVTTTLCYPPVFAPPVALGSPTLCATQYGSFMPLVLLTPSLLHHLVFVPLSLYATLSAFEPHPSSDPKPDCPRLFATCQLRSPCTLETQRLPFCLHLTNPSLAHLKASGRGLEGEVLL